MRRSCFSGDRNKRQILVPGGAGYIGSHCVVELVQSGYEPIVLDNESNASTGLLAKKVILMNDCISSMSKTSGTNHKFEDYQL